MRFHPSFRKKPRCQLGHRDVAIRLDPTDQNIGMAIKHTAPPRTALTRRCHRSRLRLALRQANRRRRAHPKATRRSTARASSLYLANDPIPKIN